MRSRVAGYTGKRGLGSSKHASDGRPSGRRTASSIWEYLGRLPCATAVASAWLLKEVEASRVASRGNPQSLTQLRSSAAHVVPLRGSQSGFAGRRSPGISRQSVCLKPFLCLVLGLSALLLRLLRSVFMHCLFCFILLFVVFLIVALVYVLCCLLF